MSAPLLSSTTFYALAGADQTANIVERDMTTGRGIVQAAIGVFSNDAFFGHRGASYCMRRTKSRKRREADRRFEK